MKSLKNNHERVNKAQVRRLKKNISKLNPEDFRLYFKCSDLSEDDISLIIDNATENMSGQGILMLNILANKCGPSAIPKDIYIDQLDVIIRSINREGYKSYNESLYLLYIRFYYNFKKTGGSFKDLSSDTELFKDIFKNVQQKYIQNSLILKQKGLPVDLSRKLNEFIFY